MKGRGGCAVVVVVVVVVVVGGGLVDHATTAVEVWCNAAAVIVRA